MKLKVTWPSADPLTDAVLLTSQHSVVALVGYIEINTDRGVMTLHRERGKGKHYSLGRPIQRWSNTARLPNITLAECYKHAMVCMPACSTGYWKSTILNNITFYKNNIFSIVHRLLQPLQHTIHHSSSGTHSHSYNSLSMMKGHTQPKHYKDTLEHCAWCVHSIMWCLPYCQVGLSM